MDCKEAEKLIIPYIRNELPDEKLVPFISHVRSCPSCFDELEIYYTIHHMLESDENDKDSSYDLHQMLEDDFEKHLTRIRKEKRKRRLSYLGIAAGILILAVLIFAIWRPDETVQFVYTLRDVFTSWLMEQGGNV